jgi:hypothetical protein
MDPPLSNQLLIDEVIPPLIAGVASQGHQHLPNAT